MATIFSIQTGAITAQKTTPNDAKAQQIFQRYSASIEITTGTPEERLEAILAHLIQIMQEGARDYDYSQRYEETMAGVEDDNEFGAS